MVFCNAYQEKTIDLIEKCHNPYFNRWFSAIRRELKWNTQNMCHNPYFNRWFSAINNVDDFIDAVYGHNPYFNRWFSAMYTMIS